MPLPVPVFFGLHTLKCLFLARKKVLDKSMHLVAVVLLENCAYSELFPAVFIWLWFPHFLANREPLMPAKYMLVHVRFVVGWLAQKFGVPWTKSKNQKLSEVDRLRFTIIDNVLSFQIVQLRVNRDRWTERVKTHLHSVSLDLSEV